MIYINLYQYQLVLLLIMIKINGFIQAHASSIMPNMNKDDINLEQINAMTKIGTKLRATLYGDYFSKFKSLCESNGLIDNKTEVL